MYIVHNTNTNTFTLFVLYLYNTLPAKQSFLKIYLLIKDEILFIHSILTHNLPITIICSILTHNLPIEYLNVN